MEDTGDQARNRLKAYLVFQKMFKVQFLMMKNPRSDLRGMFKFSGTLSMSGGMKDSPAHSATRNHETARRSARRHARYRRG